MAGLINETARIESNRCLYGRLHLLTLEAPDLAQLLAPGQFVHMKMPDMPDHVLRRPFSVYAWDCDEAAIDILYQVVGAGTEHLTTLEPGMDVELIGPIGNTWHSTQGKRLPERALLVGGGVGSAPLFEWCHMLLEAGSEVDVVLGAQTSEALVVRDRYKELLGREPFCSTDDGSYGFAGFATGLVEERLYAGSSESGKPYDYVAVCGPGPLMRIVSGIVIERGIACEVSLERRMACGIGACLSCVCDTKSQGRKRVCVDGPIFDAREVVW